MTQLISNPLKYITGLEKSAIDKMFFMDKLPDNISLLDFGCANGFLLQMLSSFFPNNNYVGYDINETLIKQAIVNPKIYYSTDFVDAFKQIEFDKNKCLLLSSVIHEVMSYSSVEEVAAFWHLVFDSGFNYIIIRDMIPLLTINRPAYDNDVHKIYHALENRVKMPTTQRHLMEFQAHWGNIDNYKNLVHFLLKYRYLDNWEREVRENYMPIHLEDLWSIIPNDYEVVYKEHYCLPFLQDKVKQDFSIELKEPIHLKLILKRS